MGWDQSRQLLIKEHLGIFKAANNYDVFDLAEGQLLMKCREPDLKIITKILRFTDFKRMTPFRVVITDELDRTLVEVRRGVALFLSKVEVFDGDGRKLGSFQQKFFSLGGKFKVLDANEQEVCMLQGKWTGWNFRFMRGEEQLAHVTKKWAGIGKELFTSADNYVLDIAPAVPGGSDTHRLLLAAVMCIDMVLKE